MTPVATAFRRHASQQAGFCESLGAPFTSELCRLLAGRLPPDSELGRRLDNWPGNPNADALVLRLTGGLHAAVLGGTAPALAACYPPAPMPAEDKLWQAIAPVLAAPGFAGWLDSAPQTNEVGRTGPLAAGMLAIAAETGLPLSLLELGASAGLNLLPDRYDLRLGGTRAGDPGAALSIDPLWEGAAPPAVRLRIADRAGVDLSPLDVCNPVETRRMLAYVWPDQPARLQRMRTAIAIAATAPPLLVQGDAAAFVEARAVPVEGVATTVFHSIAFQYFPPGTQRRIAEHMAGAGSAATAEAPLAWLSYEMSDPRHPGAPELRLTLWPGGADRLLGIGHPHGHSLRWLA